MSLIALAAEAAGAGEEAAAPFPPFETWHFPSQIFWLTILFGGLYLVLSRAILPRLGSVIERREDTIANDLDEATRLDEQATEAAQALEVRIAEAKAKARATADEARAKIDAEIAQETAKVDAEVDEKLAAAEARISKLRSEAMSNVETVASDAVQAITARFGVIASEGDAKSAVKAILS